MWASKKDNGMYIFRERYIDRAGKRKIVSVQFPNKTRATVKKAQEILDERIAELTKPAESTLTLKSVIDDYIAFKKTQVKDITYVNYFRQAKKIYDFLDPQRIVTDITAREWQHVIDTITAKISAKAARVVFQFAKAALEQAERLDGISAIPIRRVKIPKTQKTAKEVSEAAANFLTREELKEVLELVQKKAPYIADILEFQALTGLRYGELAALREEDYNEEAHTINVNATINFNYKGMRCHRGTPKNIYSLRTIELDSKASAIIEKFIVYNKAARIWFNGPGYNLPDKFIFVSRENGYPLDISYVNHLLRSLHYHKRLTTHVFRHTHISLLAEAGVPLKAIMARVGHNEPRTTMSIYTHVTDRMKDIAVKALNEITL
ncbi:MAG: site-specific integrase [Acidaminococcus sp.]|uniref:Site-specific integrase n=1 Tax=Acidaminococcus intestini TaxID=187327 RepID=A0A943EDV0_9FIRM|nr:site-specific integrase [Acidaminococcus sp.]MBS5519588.1 site-specific integrase [Acidaminococcus intestini]MDY2739488.1 site-specific integrase [Acidaminococcus sp.]